MNALVYRWMGRGLLAGGLLLAGCEGDFRTDPTRPRPTRALQNPYDHSSANNEVMVAPTGAIPLVAVDFANNKDEKPRVTTILDPFRGPQSEPVRGPATRPALTAPPDAAGAATQPQVAIERSPVISSQQL
jgi:hypothetical protein